MVKLKETILFVFIVFNFSRLYAAGFKEHILSPKIGGAWIVPIHNMDTYDNTDNMAHSGAGIINFDALFNHKCGFSFIISNNFYLLFEKNYLEESISKITVFPIYSLTFLFGYTYGIDNTFEFTIASGLGVLSTIWFLNFPLQINFAKYFNHKYGLYISIMENFCFPPIKDEDYSSLYFNVFNISLGPCFRL